MQRNLTTGDVASYYLQNINCRPMADYSSYSRTPHIAKYAVRRIFGGLGLHPQVRHPCRGQR